MAMAMAMMAYTERLEAGGGAGEDRGGRAGAGRLGDLLHRRVVRGGEVLGEAADHLGEHEADDDGAEAASSRRWRGWPRRRPGAVADVDEAEGTVPMTVMMPAVRKPRLIGLRALVSPSLAFTA